MAFLTKFPSEVLCIILSYLDVTTIELGFKESGDRRLWQLISNSTMRLALKLEVSPMCLVFPLSRFCQYRSLHSLSIRLEGLSIKADPSWLLNLPPTIQEIDFSFEEAQICLIRPLSASDDDLTRVLYSTRGYTVMELGKYFPNLRLLHIETEKRIPTTLPLKAALPSPFPFDIEPQEPLKEISWSEFMCFRFIQELPPTITSLKLGKVIYDAMQLLKPYLDLLVAPTSATESPTPLNASFPMNDNQIPPTWPSIATLFPSLVHWLPTANSFSTSNNLGRGTLTLFHQLISAVWGPTYWDSGKLILRGATALQHLTIHHEKNNSWPKSKELIEWPGNLISLHLKSAFTSEDQPSHKGVLTALMAFPSSLRYLTMDIWFPWLISPAALPSQLVQLDISRVDFGYAFKLDQLPRTLVYLKLRWKRSVLVTDFSGLPTGLKSLNLNWERPNGMTPALLETLPVGLSALELAGCDDLMDHRHIQALPRGLIQLCLARGSHFRGEAVPFLPPHLQYLSARLSVLIKEEDLSKMPSSLQSLQLGSFQTDGGLFQRHLKRLSDRDAIDTWRTLLPEGLRHPAAMIVCCNMAFSLGLTSLPEGLEKINFHRCRFATLATLSQANLPNLTSLKIPHIGYAVQSIPPTLKTLVITQSDTMDKTIPPLLSNLQSLKKLSLRCDWNWDFPLPPKLTYLQLRSIGKQSEQPLKNHKKLKTLICLLHPSSVVPLYALPPSITKFAYKATGSFSYVGNFAESPFHIPQLTNLKLPSIVLPWENLLLLPRTLKSLSVLLPMVTSYQLVEWLSEAQWKQVQELLNLTDPQFANIVLQSHFPNVIFHQKKELRVYWDHSHYHLIPRSIPTLQIETKLLNITLAATREICHAFAKLPRQLTSLSINLHIVTPHSIPKWLPRTLERLQICVDHWNVQSFHSLPTTLTALKISYKKEIRPKFMNAIPRQIKGLSISFDGPGTIDPLSIPQLPPSLTALELCHYYGLVSSDFQGLPSTLTALKVPSSYQMGELSKYLLPSVSLITSRHDQLRYYTRIFESQYSLPSLQKGSEGAPKI